jgi:hypothetical protein
VVDKFLDQSLKILRECAGIDLVAGLEQGQRLFAVKALTQKGKDFGGGLIEFPITTLFAVEQHHFLEHLLDYNGLGHYVSHHLNLVETSHRAGIIAGCEGAVKIAGKGHMRCFCMGDNCDVRLIVIKVTLFFCNEGESIKLKAEDSLRGAQVRKKSDKVGNWQFWRDF